MLTLMLMLISGVIVVLTLIWFCTRRREELEPIIELENLVNCKKCGSLIPEGVGKCAFCGASQTGADTVCRC